MNGTESSPVVESRTPGCWGRSRTGRSEDLEIAEGQLASVELHRLMFEKDEMDPEEWEALRRDLLEYCKEDTLVLVKLRRRLSDTPVRSQRPRARP